MRNYDRKNYDKENSFDIGISPGGNAKKCFVSNNELRRKIDQNMALAEKDQPNVLEQSELNFTPNDNSHSNKRENARRRGFDMKVSNIDTINQKISGLLNIVRKDRQREKNQSQTGGAIDKDRRQTDKSPNYKLMERIKRVSGSNKAEKFLSREQMEISPFGEEMSKDRKKSYYHHEDVKKEEIQPLDKMRTIRTKYQEDESLKEELLDLQKNGKDRRSKNIDSWWNNVLKEQQAQKQDRIKQDVPQKNNLEQQKIAFDKMLEDRRKQRHKNRETQRDKSTDKMTPQHKSVMKPKYNYNESEEMINYSKKDSPIAKVKEQYFESRREQLYAQVKTASPRKGSSSKQNFHRFAEVSYLEENGKHQKKIHSTARLIDQQLVKIKEKINQSEVSQKKIDTFKPKVNNEQFKTKQHTIRIAENISAQVQFDSHLKPARQSFQKLSGDSKWNQLEQMVQSKGLKINKKTLKKLLKIGADEHNPFGGERLSIQLKELVELMAAAQKNWDNCVLKCASTRNLKNQCFQISDIDLNNKGYLSLEDLVCFVNLYASTFYRNRDIALVMRRLQLIEGSRSNSGIEYSTFFDAFTA